MFLIQLIYILQLHSMVCWQFWNILTWRRSRCGSESEYKSYFSSLLFSNSHAYTCNEHLITHQCSRTSQYFSQSYSKAKSNTTTSTVSIPIFPFLLIHKGFLKGQQRSVKSICGSSALHPQILYFWIKREIGAWLHT